MEEKLPIRIDDRIDLIDGFDMGLPERTGTYVIKEDELTLIETGPSPSVEHIKQGLVSLGFSLDDVKHIIVTHVHLDHAGGAGLLLESCPNAQVIVHPRGYRHLEDPT
ncbi:MAG TPA: MBL fold metallo-hydrolase, partial [Bacillota bacterium]|nr:MBL fold metallo-hydrolase [Bacillota bacterium]